MKNKTIGAKLLKNKAKFYVRFFSDMLIFDSKIFESDALLLSILSRSIPIYVKFIITKNVLYFEFRVNKLHNYTKLNYKSRQYKSNTSIYKFFKQYPWLKDLSGKKLEVTYDEITNLWKIQL